MLIKTECLQTENSFSLLFINLENKPVKINLTIGSLYYFEIFRKHYFSRVTVLSPSRLMMTIIIQEPYSDLIKIVLATVYVKPFGTKTSG